MKQITLAAIGAIVILTLAYCAQDTPKTTPEAKAATTSVDPVKRGEYLVTIGGCNDCHSPKVMTQMGPEPDPARLLSGHPANEPLPAITDKKVTAPGQWVLFSSGLTATVGPWGTSFAANLTPDDTGIGNWTEAQFFKAIREGKSKGLDGTRPMLPPMPWFNIAKMTDDDLRAMFVYLKSLKPVKNVVPNPIPPTS
ncbi:MAG: diheme cytochrome c-553 [Saprospiraceae bacterium]|nr:diheme cytochrome c-553 [Saprospiraceae bacterium]